jgi:hypothetical protein
MNFENKLMPFLLSAYEEGYQAPSTVSFHAHQPILDTASPSMMVKSSSFLKDFPSLLFLEASIVPVQSSVSLQAEFVDQGKSCGVISVHDLETPYHKNGRHTSLTLRYRGRGHYQIGAKTHDFLGIQVDRYTLDLPSADLIYEKPFKLTALSHLSVMINPGDAPDQYRITPPGDINTFPRFPYGGHYVPGMPLEKVQQLYLFIRKFQSKTEALVEATSDFLERGIRPPIKATLPQGDIVFLEPPNAHEQMTLADALNGGQARVTLWKDKESSSPVSCLYHSVGFHLKGDQLVKIAFQKEETSF